MQKLSYRTIGTLCVALVVSAYLLRAPLAGSFTLDETISLWVVQGSLSDTLQRAWEYQGQSPLYFLLLHFVVSVAGQDELCLRLLSTLPMGLSVIPLAMIARKFSIARSWPVIALTLCTDPLALRYSIMVRPYGLAFFCATMATLVLLTWMETGKRLHLICYSVFFALTLYFQYLFALLGLFHLVLFASMRKRLNKGKWLPLMGAWAGSAVLLVPAGLHILAWIPKRSMLMLYARPSVLELAKRLVPVEVVAFAGLGLITSYLYVPTKLEKGQVRPLLLLLVWCLLPPLALYCLSLIGQGMYLVDRYYLWRTAGVALLMGYCFNRFSSEHFLKLALCVWTCFAAVLNGARVYHVDDWKGAQTELAGRSPALPVLLHSGLIELAELPYPTDSLDVEYLTIPLQVYSVKQPITPIPDRFATPLSKEYLTTTLQKQLAGHTAFVLILSHNKSIEIDKQRTRPVEHMKETFERLDYHLVEHSRRGELHLLYFST